MKIILSLKVEEICRDCSPVFFYGISDNAPGFCLAISETYLWPCETPNMKCFAKIINGWIQSTIFVENSILDVSLGSEYVSDYQKLFLLQLIDASTLNLSWMFLIWLVFYFSI